MALPIRQCYRTVLVQRKARIPRELARMTVRVTEISGVSFPKRIDGRLHNFSAGQTRNAPPGSQADLLWLAAFFGLSAMFLLSLSSASQY